MLGYIYALFDIILGGAIIASHFTSSKYFILIAAIAIIKGIISLKGSFSSGYFFDWMGIMDVIAGIVLLGHWISWFGIFSIIKGVYSAATIRS